MNRQRLGRILSRCLTPEQQFAIFDLYRKYEQPSNDILLLLEILEEYQAFGWSLDLCQKIIGSTSLDLSSVGSAVVNVLDEHKYDVYLALRGLAYKKTDSVLITLLMHAKEENLLMYKTTSEQMIDRTIDISFREMLDPWILTPFLDARGYDIDSADLRIDCLVVGTPVRITNTRLQGRLVVLAGNSGDAIIEGCTFIAGSDRISYEEIPRILPSVTIPIQNRRSQQPRISPQKIRPTSKQSPSFRPTTRRGR